MSIRCVSDINAILFCINGRNEKLKKIFFQYFELKRIVLKACLRVLARIKKKNWRYHNTSLSFSLITSKFFSRSYQMVFFIRLFVCLLVRFCQTAVLQFTHKSYKSFYRDNNAHNRFYILYSR